MVDIKIKLDDKIATFITNLKARVKQVTLDDEKAEMPLSKEAEEYCKVLGWMNERVDSDVVTGLSRILTKMTGEKIAVKRKSGKYKALMMVVPLKCPNSHDYTIGEPTLIYSGDCAIDSNQRCGNHLPDWDDGGKPIRKATEGEIDKYFDALTLDMALKTNMKDGDADYIIENFCGRTSITRD